MAPVIISIFLIGGGVIAIYEFLEDYFLEENKKMWHNINLKKSGENKKTA